MNRVEKALAYHKKGYNCNQAVACSFCDKMKVVILVKELGE